MPKNLVIPDVMEGRRLFDADPDLVCTGDSYLAEHDGVFICLFVCLSSDTLVCVVTRALLM